jgi:hypothetical protein
LLYFSRLFALAKKGEFIELYHHHNVLAKKKSRKDEFAKIFSSEARSEEIHHSIAHKMPLISKKKEPIDH